MNGPAPGCVELPQIDPQTLQTCMDPAQQGALSYLRFFLTHRENAWSCSAGFVELPQVYPHAQ